MATILIGVPYGCNELSKSKSTCVFINLKSKLHNVCLQTNDLILQQYLLKNKKSYLTEHLCFRIKSD